MSPIALYLASGESLYTGTLLLLILLALSPKLRRPWPLRLRNLLAWSSLALILLACAPFPLVTYALFTALFLTWFITANTTSSKPLIARTRTPAALTLALAALLACVLEFPHRIAPHLSARPTHLTVIGDSLSAGIDPRQPAWPALFQQQTAIPTTNLARPGITTTEALDQAKLLTPNDTCVLIEVGGNDLIDNLPAADFQSALDALLTAAGSPNRALLMFELPLLPHKIPYGQIQRRLAAKHHVTLLPKRLLIQVLSAPDATSDGLHLSPTGAAAMTSLLQSLLPPPAATTR
jgi:lysophospholipase L1-like esterase